MGSVGGVGGESGENKKADMWVLFVGSWDGVRDIKDDECGRSEYKGENHAE
jgi:hypothetical protein